MTISLTLPRMVIDVVYQPMSFTLVPLQTEDLDGIVVTPSPVAAGTVMLSMLADGISSPLFPVIEPVIGLQLHLDGECETLEPVTENTPMSIGFGLKGIV